MKAAVVYSQPGEDFASVERRLNIVARVIGAAEWVGEGAYDDAYALLADLEGELRKAIEQNEELEEAA